MSDKKPKKDLFIKSPFGPDVIRLKQDGSIQHGQLGERKEGEPINTELVHLSPTPASPLVYEGETAFDPAEHGVATSKGPARVTNQKWRDGWDQTFGSGSEESLPN